MQEIIPPTAVFLHFFRGLMIDWTIKCSCLRILRFLGTVAHYIAFIIGYFVLFTINSSRINPIQRSITAEKICLCSCLRRAYSPFR